MLKTVIVFLLLALGAAVAHGQTFQFGGKKPATILFDENDHKVVKIVADAFAGDVELVTGQRPKIGETSQNVVIIGTLGASNYIETLRRSKKINTAELVKRRESFLLQIVKNPFPGVANALVIAGSDRRGTAFGVFEVSQRLGVSPWVWWADSMPKRNPNLVLELKTFLSQPPSVKYRGVFINDEDWGFEPWARQTFEPENGGPGSKTYAKLFELLLRLKANACWPAMHEVTKPFNSDPRNARVADDYAIVMGSSHAEPMLRNNVGEWKDAKENFNFLANEKGVSDYWEERAKTNGKFENVWTIGMRGIHDSAIQGPKTQPERIATLEKIFAVQRSLLEKYSGKRAAEIPQIFCPYKEVLDDYRAGLKVPDDVTIVFPDDNFGYIRYFPTAAEQKRKGGFGVYYHISYLGRPLAYLWLNTTPPALIFEEMSKAYANGMRDFWMLNVGDLKPGEIGTELFMQMAYDAERWTIDNQHEFLENFARREFGAANSKEIASVLDEYYRLNYQRKPEHLQWYLPKTEPRPSTLTPKEKLDRIAAFERLANRAADVFLKEKTNRPALYEIVIYPVRMSAAANIKFFATELALDAQESESGGKAYYAKLVMDAERSIDRETRYFNTELKGAKWNGIMSPEMTPGQWPSFRTTPPRLNAENFTARDWDKADISALQPLVKDDSVIVEAENFRRQASAEGFAWRVIRGLGKHRDSIAVFPQLRMTFVAGKEPVAEYEFETTEDGTFDIDFSVLPTHPPGDGAYGRQRLAFSIDDAVANYLLFDLSADTNRASWAEGVLDPEVVASRTGVKIAKGKHTLRIFAVDSGIVVDRIVFKHKP